MCATCSLGRNQRGNSRVKYVLRSELRPENELRHTIAMEEGWAVGCERK